jgi:hypothetical protein
MESGVFIVGVMVGILATVTMDIAADDRSPARHRRPGAAQNRSHGGQ